ITVVKLASPFPADRVQNVASGGASTLNRALRNTRHRLPVRGHHGQITDDKDLRMLGDAEIRLDEDAPASIDGYAGAQQSSERRRRIAGGPEYGARNDSLVPDAHRLWLDGRHH